MAGIKLNKEHLFALQSISNPVLSPNNESLVFTQTMIHGEDNKYYNHIYHLDLASYEMAQWTFKKERISTVSWSPNGEEIAFLSNRDNQMQLYLMSAKGGEAFQLTNLVYGVQHYEWSPCGTKIWFSALVEENVKITEMKKEKDATHPKPYIVQGMKYKLDGVGLKNQTLYSQIVSVDLATQEITQFTEGNVDTQLQAISRDGQELVVACNRLENRDDNFRTQLYLVNIETRQEQVLVDEEGTYGDVSYSLDNRYIAYVGNDASFKNATHNYIYVYDRATGLTQNLTLELDAPVGDYSVADLQQGVQASAVTWTAYNALYFQLSTMGDVRLYYATLDGAIYPASPEDEHIYSYAIKNDGNGAIIAVSNPTFPGELFDFDITTGAREQITFFNDDFLKSVELSQPESIVYAAKDGKNIYGWLMKPVGFTEGEKYPLIVEIHGGPHAMYANTFFHELQLLAANGYGVLYVNPRGSHGYSQAFVDAVRGDYGGGDYEDIMSGLDYVLAQHDWIDETKLGVTGGSYGGFMTNWIVGHTNRFKAAVTQRSISNWVSFHGVSDIGYYFNEWQLKANMSDVETLWQHSPLKYVENVETPLLILHGEHDLRCPIEQAEQLYIALKSMEKEVGFVRFPESDHNLSRSGLPNLRLERLNQIVSWFENYLN